MFNRYHEKLKSRLENTLATLEQTLKGFDYELDEYLVIDHSTMPRHPKQKSSTSAGGNASKSGAEPHAGRQAY